MRAGIVSVVFVRPLRRLLQLAAVIVGADLFARCAGSYSLLL